MNSRQRLFFVLFLNSDIKTLSVKALCSITYEEQLDLAEAEVADWVSLEGNQRKSIQF